MKDVRPRACMIANFKSTVKTHKTPGSQTIRPLHALARSPFAPGMRLARHFLVDAMRHFRHVLADSHDLRRKLDSLVVETTDRLMKVDVKDSFFSGDHESLYNAIATAGLGPQESRRQVNSLFKFSLFSQYEKWKDQIFQVMQGTGMGLIHSGDMADLIFAKLCEENWILDKDVQSRFPIRGYFRYKDDLIVRTGGSNESRKQWFHEFQENRDFSD